ncbi:MAG: hypothetical protein CVV24_01685 [Ignavibacteriae bacterium HGW-Ignavibacteriae-3]|nr:MAG: hypothetical protein CVV24_01685 [Ignavibacteriae bacterium HGW-Ignavibacteriae-3]
MTSQKQKIITFLLIFAVILLIVDIAIDKIQQSELPEKSFTLKEVSVVKIDSAFFKVLGDYGIESGWISKKKVKQVYDDSTKVEYSIKIPADIPAPLIIRDINKIIEKDITGFVSEEKRINGSTEIRIYVNEILKLKATLLPVKTLIRKRNSLAFIISDALDLGSGNFNKFLGFTQPLACMIVPDKSLMLQADTLKKYRKEYVLLLNNEINDSKMKLKQEYPKELLRGSIKNILSSFRDSKIVAVDEKSALYISPIYNFVRDDFKRQGIKLFPLKEFIQLEGADESELFSKFKFYANDTTGMRQKIFICSFNNFEKIIMELEQYKKKGHKIIALSESYMTQNTN